jgi:membrane protease YdiL (CAAX protease family)
MAHPATNRFNFMGQAGILIMCIGSGLVLGSILSLIPMWGAVDLFGGQKESTQQIMDKLLIPENAPRLRWMQFINTLFLFFLPALAYARLCHRKPRLHLGLQNPPRWSDLLMVILVVCAAVPAAAFFEELTLLLPWGKDMMAQFKEAEVKYMKQVAVLTGMRSPFDYLRSLIVIAFLPALFEEILFRGAIQNLLSRWMKWPLLAILITSILFSAIHGSYLGFLSRFVLGFMLGWLFYRSGNLWLSIWAHFLNNALAATSMYLSARKGKPIGADSLEDEFPVWAGALGLAALIGILVLLDHIMRKRIDRPGEEALIPIPDDIYNPFSEPTGSDPQPENAAEPTRI